MSSSRARGAGLYYLVAAVATAVSVDTSWRFFGQVLGIPETNGERWIMFAVVELAMLACAVSMRAAVRRSEPPGPARLLAWALCAMSGYMALALSGPVQGIARVALGPVLALVTLHLALGIEIRVATGGQRAGTWARVGRELRERLLSRVGLADDSRDALARTRDRAADRAARLATARRVAFRRARLARAVRTAAIAHDAATRRRMLDAIATYRALGDLANVDRPAPWITAPVVLIGGQDAPVQDAGPVQDAPVQDETETGRDEIPEPAAVTVPESVREDEPVPAARPARRTDTELRTALRDVPRDPDGTVPPRRAAAAVGCGYDRARRLLGEAGLLPEGASEPVNGKPAARLASAARGRR